MTDDNGDVWRSDAVLNAGGNVVQPSLYTSVAYTFDSAPETAQYTAVLNTERYGALSYSIPISGNGVYEVQLLVVETWHQGVTTRVFHVDVQGTRALSNVNMVVDEGFQHPYLLRVPVVVTDGSLAITVQLSSAPGSPEPPALYGIILYKDVVVPVLPDRRWRRDAVEAHHAAVVHSIAAQDGYVEHASWASGTGIVVFAIAILATTAAVVIVTMRRASIAGAAVRSAMNDIAGGDGAELHLHSPACADERDFLQEDLA